MIPLVAIRVAPDWTLAALKLVTAGLPRRHPGCRVSDRWPGGRDLNGKGRVNRLDGGSTAG